MIDTLFVHYSDIIATATFLLIFVPALFGLYKHYKSKPRLKVRFVKDESRVKGGYLIQVKNTSHPDIKITSYGLRYKKGLAHLSTVADKILRHKETTTFHLYDDGEDKLGIEKGDYAWVADGGDNHYKSNSIK